MLAAALCLILGGEVVTLHATAFTLAWQHTVEKVVWEEDYLVAGGWLYATAARIRGSGAGMEPPDHATLIDGTWHYRPRDRWHRSLTLAASEFGEDYSLCVGKRCRPLATYAARSGPVTLAPCAGLR